MAFVFVCFMATLFILGAQRARADIQQPRGSWNLRGTMGPIVSELDKTLIEMLAVMEAESHWQVINTPAEIEAAMRHTFIALPKNRYGRLSHKSVKHLLHRWFLAEHGWVMHGLESNFERPADIPILSALLEDMVELAEFASPGKSKDWAFMRSQVLLEAGSQHRGFTLSGVAALAFMMEQHIFYKAVTMLLAGYEKYNLNTTDLVTHTELSHVLAVNSAFLRGNLRPLLPPMVDDLDNLMEKCAKQTCGFTAKMILMCSDAIHDVNFLTQDTRNPFKQPLYTFDEALAMLAPTMRAFGHLQNSECVAMKSELVSIASEETGLVPLTKFWSNESKIGNVMTFSESADYLEKVGALDKPDHRPGRVRIANYMKGPSNCIGESHLFSICCLDECEAVLSTFERVLAAPSATPEQVLEVASGIATETRAENEPISPHLVAKLHEVAQRRGGQVLLHGRLFAQWLHHAFPNECAFPAVLDDPSATTTSFWGIGGRGNVSRVQGGHKFWKASATEKQAALENPAVHDEVLEMAPEWLDQEDFPHYDVQGDAHGAAAKANDVAQSMAYLVLLAAMACGVARLACEAPGKIAAALLSSEKSWD